MDFILLKIVNFFFVLFLEDLRKTEKWNTNPYKQTCSKKETQKWKLDPLDLDGVLISPLLSSFLPCTKQWNHLSKALVTQVLAKCVFNFEFSL